MYGDILSKLAAGAHPRAADMGAPPRTPQQQIARLANPQQKDVASEPEWRELPIVKDPANRKFLNSLNPAQRAQALEMLRAHGKSIYSAQRAADLAAAVGEVDQTYEADKAENVEPDDITDDERRKTAELDKIYRKFHGARREGYDISQAADDPDLYGIPESHFQHDDSVEP
jgi:hypothetical protein